MTHVQLPATLTRVARALATVSLLFACWLSASWYTNGGRHCLSPYARVLAEPIAIRDAAFMSLDAEDAYHVYMCGYRVMHPPMIALDTPFARMGASAIPVLRRNLISEKSDFGLLAIIAVLAEMQRIRTYDVRRDSALRQLTHEALVRVADPTYHEMAARAIHDLEALGVEK